MTEFSLSLRVAADDMAKAQSALAAMAGRPRSARTTRTCTYYDTQDEALHRNDLALRVQRQGRRYVQTVTANGAGDKADQAGGTWEDTIARQQPDPTAPECGSRLGAALGAEALKPVFTTVVRHSTFALEPKPGTRIAVAVERGEIRPVDGGDAVPIHDIALSLEAGDPAVLWDVGLRLLEIVPFRIGTASLAERGYRLVGKAKDMAPVHYAEPIRLDPAITLDAALQIVGRRCLAMVLGNEDAALAGNLEGIHQIRVAVRRLRALLSALKPMLPDEHFRWANGELKWLGKVYAAARNWDVFAYGLLAPVTGALARERDLERLAKIVETRRRGAYERARETMQSARYTATVLRLSRWFEARGWRDQPVTEESARLVAPVGAAAPGILGRLYRKTRKRTRDFAACTPVERHQLRIALKKLRYTVDFLESLYDAAAVKRFIKTVKPLQDDLGYANDVRSAHMLVADLDHDENAALERAGGIVLGWHDRGIAESEARTEKHVTRFRRADPFW
ncbi:MAG TPA: CHAD domain-containing protein [Stellaceae bacterium]|nr:CHAD domain-containing protein [Stellaceae bacterium]